MMDGWTEEDQVLLGHWHDSDESLADTAGHFDRTEDDVRCMAEGMGLPYDANGQPLAPETVDLGERAA